MDINLVFQKIAIYALPILFAITAHEAAHAYVALRLGDNTAWKLGRVTLNPASHIDPLGTIVIPLLLLWATAGAFVFGYARPVPVRFGNLRNPRRDMMWVAFAGPASNFVQALVWGLLIVVLRVADVEEPFLYAVCDAGVSVNLVMFVFNLFPLLPLDGGRVLQGMLPTDLANSFSRIEPFGFFIVMLLVYKHVIDDIWMRPLMDLSAAVLKALLAPLNMLL